MRLPMIAFVMTAVTVLGPAGRAQQPQRTLEERVAALELELENLAARVDARGNVAQSPLITSDAPLYGRIDQLERSISMLATDLQRLERQVDNATREATEARRTAMAAERLARDAARPR